MFKINEDKLKHISEEFGVDLEHVRSMYNAYRQIHDGMKEQYLAHIIRTMEVQLQKLTGNPLFKIVIDPINVDGCLREQGDHIPIQPLSSPARCVCPHRNSDKSNLFRLPA
jgi:hypothetical protein